MNAPGKVWLIGAGPGDPGLMTVAGVAALAEAEVVVYDRLVSAQLLELAPSSAERIFVGKEASAHALGQEEINALLVEKACQGKRVVRLKGGDPFVFGRGGEEAEALAAGGIPFEVVPGVTSAVAAPAYAGIPITHRGLASSFAVITGHEDPTKAETALDWSKLATGVDTLVFLMGAATLPQIVEKLVEHGRPAATPVAVIRWGTTPAQEVVTGTLADIARRVKEARLEPPAVAVVGEVVRLRETLCWFDSPRAKPLFGKRVLVTRTRQQASALSRLLSQQGAEPIELPALELVPRADPRRLARALGALARGRYQWVVFTSANGVDIFFQRLSEAGRDARAFAGARVCAIGPGTAGALAGRGLRADLVPEEFVAESVVEALARQNVAKSRILLPRAEGARRELVRGLRALGARVDELPLYVAAPPGAPEPEALRRLRAGEVDVVTLASSSAVRNLLKLLEGDTAPLKGPLIACIGPVTARTAREAGLQVGVESKEHTIPGLVQALRDHYGVKAGAGGNAASDV
jgi:uroporphyrinogen III methyltransferase/synthase